MFLFYFRCISFLCTNTATRQEPVQGFKWYQRKNKQATTTTTTTTKLWLNDGRAGKFTRTHSPSGVDMRLFFIASLVVLCHTCVLYCGISFKNITQIGQIYLALDAELYHLLLQWL